MLQHLALIASGLSLRDTASYGAGLRKFHVFCDIFSVPEAQRLPASFALIHSFVLWAASDPSPNDIALAGDVPFEPVAGTTIRKYMSAVRAWHLAQGWTPPLSSDELIRINWSLRGLENQQAQRRKRPLRPPITIHMLATLKQELDLTHSWDACVWAAACCAFWGLMRFGEVTVKSRAAFTPGKCLARKHMVSATDIDGRPYIRLDLPSAKTAAPGEIQSVWLVREGTLCPLEALRNLLHVCPAGDDDPLFSWIDAGGAARPLTIEPAMNTINNILVRHGWGTKFGHSFRIGGASFYLAQGVSTDIVRIAGRWRSMAYEAYIRSFEQVSSRHLANIASRYGL